MPLKEGEIVPIDVDKTRVIRTQAEHTIQSIVDALVELVTNSDDSYRILEDNNTEVSGEILIFIKRHYIERYKKSVCDFLSVQDYASGMNQEELQRALSYGFATSGFHSGKNVRGYFGRGLKEVIIKLGIGTITTVKDNLKNIFKFYMDRKGPVFKVILSDARCQEPNGTKVEIEVNNKHIPCPTYETLSKQISNHYALRDIMASNKRIVKISFENIGAKRGKGSGNIKASKRLTYNPPEGELVQESELPAGELGKIKLCVFESLNKLRYKPYDPTSEVGLLIKTEGAILDNQIFDLGSNDAAHYFFGYVDVPGIAYLLRRGRGELVDPNRGGLAWRSPLCEQLFKIVKNELKKHVERKEKSLTRESNKQIPEVLQNKFRKICNLLNKFAKQELEDNPGFGEEGGNVISADEINELTIRPEVAYAQVNTFRSFTVYVPAKEILFKENHPKIEVEIVDQTGLIEFFPSEVTIPLKINEKHPNLFSCQFSVRGISSDAKAKILCSYGDDSGIAAFSVREPSTKKKGTLSPRRGGFFKKIDFTYADWNQRVRYFENSGEIVINLAFPPISDYITDDSGSGSDTPQGSIMTAELVAEAFSKQLAREKLRKGEVITSTVGEIDAYNAEVNRLMRQYLKHIHQALVVK